MKKKIGVYGGSFDPVHLGHINLAVEIMEARGLDEIWFCPTFISPHKKLKSDQASAEDRFNMLSQVIEGESRFRVIDTELRRLGSSYTIDTLKDLVASHPFNFHLIMGEDAAEFFFSWKQAEEIVKLVPLLVGSRTPLAMDKQLPGSELVSEALKRGMTPTRMMDISSTEIRFRILKNLYCGHLLQRKVLDYILLNHLYSKGDR